MISGSDGAFNMQTSSERNASNRAKKKIQNKLDRIENEETEFLKRDFDPRKGLHKDSSTEKLIEKHGEALNKMHALHKEAQTSIGVRERLP